MNGHDERTWKQTSREKIANECLKIEKKGGDVLGYLKTKGFIYSTKSTWENLQRVYLKRGPGQITNGKPKEDEDMAKGKEWSEEELQAIAEEAVGIVRAGQNPRIYLRSKGFMDIKTGWAKMRKIYADAHPGEELPRIRTEKKEIETYSPNAIYKKGYPYSTKKGPQTVSDDSPKYDSPKTAEAPQDAKMTQREASGGYLEPEKIVKVAAEVLGQRMGTAVKAQPKAITTCCAPAKPSGVSVPDELPEEPKKKVRVIMVETEMGTFKREGDSIIFRRNDNDKDYNNTMRLTPEGWRALMADMDEVLNKLSLRAN